MTQAPDTAQQSLLETASAALERHEWRNAFDGLSAADAEQPLSPAGLELLATAAWWTGQLPVAIETRERAFANASKAGDYFTAVEVAINLARDHVFKLAMPAAMAWIKRAEKMLEGLDENPGHGWVAAVKATIASVGGDNEESIAQATLAQEIAERLGIADLRAFAMAGRAAGLMARGDVEAGLALADEAATAAISGELQPAVAGGVFCSAIEACAGIGDVKRALEWTEAQDRWCRREHINGFPGMCRIFRSDVKRMHGAWPEAEAEALQASVELRGYIPGAAGLALYQIGEIRLRRGDLPAAEEALLGAHGLGQDTEPALSLLRLAQGKTAAAAESIRRALNEPGRPSWRAPSDSAVYRLMLLPAQVEILLAAGDVAGARASADALAELAGRFQTGPVVANSVSAAGLVALAEGNAEEAATRLREAIGMWVALDAPYEAAQMRLALADAYRAAGQPDLGAIEARTARDAFEQLGAALDLRHAEKVVASFAGEGGAPLGTATARVDRVFMFTDIVDSTKLAETLGDETWDGVIRMHDRTVRAAVAEQGGEEVKATGDGFFLAFADADQAIQAAIAIQKRLAEQRRAQGFAVSVRIGLHGAQANRVGLDYTGSGVNQAARIGAVAESGEILVSASTLAAAGLSFGERARRTVELKGLSAPVEVVSIDWS
ncbi:MAG TPA: adenylate/guanylate cyclase domain-containing protein [Methylomirabilota bacterium]|nr:adenylate/guanylate cyclase domain-containing protein [Methylomirabilota bacterium]